MCNVHAVSEEFSIFLVIQYASKVKFSISIQIFFVILTISQAQVHLLSNNMYMKHINKSPCIHPFAQSYNTMKNTIKYKYII